MRCWPRRPSRRGLAALREAVETVSALVEFQLSGD